MRMSAAGSSYRGFTLIELLVVLTIMVSATLAIALVGPGLRQAADIEAAVSGLTSTLKKARMIAISRERTSEVTVDMASRRYLINGRRQSHSLPSSVFVRKHTGEAGFRLKFYPDGSADNAILSLHDGKRQVALAVSPLTGRVTRQR